MNTLKLTAKDFKKSDSYWSDYIGEVDVTDYDGHIEIDANLGWVRFAQSIRADGRILALAGTGIEAGMFIEAGWSIKAGTSIKAGMDIKAGGNIKARTSIKAGWGIKARGNIEAGTSIEAGESIEAGGGIKTETGIKAGLSITCKLSLVATATIFAGVCYWRRADESEKTITCAKLEGGATVEYGILNETGLPEQKKLSKAEAEKMLSEKLGEEITIE